MKGVIYTIEAVVAVLMVFVILVLLFQNTPVSTQFERINYKIEVYRTLEILDKNGELRTYALNGDTTTIQNKLNNSLPDIISYQVTISNLTTNLTSIPSASDKSDILSVNYFISGDIGSYIPREIIVYMWGFP